MDNPKYENKEPIVHSQAGTLNIYKIECIYIFKEIGFDSEE